MSDADPPKDVWDLNHISTQWSQLGDANVFVLRYTNAISRYLQQLLRDEHEAQEVLQTFLVRVLERGFEHADPHRGRFRHYLSRAVRNAAITHRRKAAQRAAQLEHHLESAISDSYSIQAEWNQEWHRCLLDRAMKSLQTRERTTAGNLGYTIIQLQMTDGDGDSAELAAKVSKRAGRELSPAAFRKQLSRARQALAAALVREVAETLDSPTEDEIRNELKEIGLWPYVEDFV